MFPQPWLEGIYRPMERSHGEEEDDFPREKGKGMGRSGQTTFCGTADAGRFVFGFIFTSSGWWLTQTRRAAEWRFLSCVLVCLSFPVWAVRLARAVIGNPNPAPGAVPRLGISVLGSAP